MEITNVDRPTMIQKVFDYMRSGSPLTAGEARKRFRVTNMRATMSDLREAFYDGKITKVLFFQTKSIL